MALRVCVRALVGCGRVLEGASWRLTAGGAAGSRGPRDGFISTPARFITSDAFLNRLMKGKVAEADGSFHRLPVSVPLDSVDQQSLLMRHPDQPENPKVLKVAIVGAPNSGKSTLSNQLLGRKVFAVSKKVHTTRRRARGVLTEDNTQIILLDTPGFTTRAKVKRHQLEESLLVDPWSTVKEADLVAVLVDVTDRWTRNRLDFEVLKCLAQNPDIPAILILNKVDLMHRKDKLLAITADLTCGVVNGRKIDIRPVIKPPSAKKKLKRDSEISPEDESTEDESTDSASGAETSSLSKDQLKALKDQQGWARFKEVFMLSSLDPEDVETLKKYCVLAAKPGPWLYHSEVLTDQSPEDICHSIIREKLLEYLPKEVPYTVTQSIDLFQEGENGELEISVKLYSKKESQLRMVIGLGGQTVAKIAREASDDLSQIYLKEVRMKVAVTMKK